MDILSKTDDEVYELAKPIWDNLVKSSNLKDYGGFTKDFSTQMLFGANEVELGKQWANNKIITNLKETFEPFGCLRRGVHVTVLIKQTNKEISGEFLGRLVLGEEDGVIKVFCATIYQKIKIDFKSNIYLTNNYTGVLTVVMQPSNVKILNKIFNAKIIIIKTGIFLSLATYWGVILVGTFITFS